MVFETWWDDVHFGQAGVQGQVRAFHAGLDLGVPDWVARVLVDRWVQKWYVHAPDLLTLVLVSNGIGHDCICAASKKGLSMVKQYDDRIVCQTCLDVFSLLFEAIPVTVPHDNEVVPTSTGGQLFAQSGFIELAKGTGRDVFCSGYRFYTHCRVHSLPRHLQGSGFAVRRGCLHAQRDQPLEVHGFVIGVGQLHEVKGLALFLGDAFVGGMTSFLLTPMESLQDLVALVGASTFNANRGSTTMVQGCNHFSYK